MLLCGAAKACITPDLPINLAGYRPDLIATGVLDDLFATALYVESGGEGAVLIAMDTISVDAEFVAEVQAGVAKATGLPARAVFTTASHSHSTPRVRKARENESAEVRAQCEAYRSRVVNGCVEAAHKAKAGAEEVTAHYNTARIRENLNRRVFFPGGEYFYQPKQKNLLPLADGYTEEELGFVFFRSVKTKNFVSVLANYTAHPLTIGDSSSLVSADYPGVLKREIERNLGGTAVFVTGSCGDNHPLGAEAGIARCERMGLALAEKVLYHRWDAVDLDVTTVGADHREVVLPALSSAQLSALPRNFDFHRKQAPAEQHPQGFRTRVSLLGIGPLLFVGVPGETTAELGARLKWESPFPKTFVMFMATDNLGYIPHRNAYEWGGYEVLTSSLAPSAGRKLIDEALDGAEALKVAMERRGPPLRLPGQGAGPVPSNAPGQAR